jgi:hypothetical protein
MKKYVTVKELEKYSNAMEEFLINQVLLNHEFGYRLTKLERKNE